MSTTPDVRPGDSASPSNLLVLVPSVGYDEDDICNELLDAPDAHAHELLVIGASERSLFKRLFRGSLPSTLGRETRAPIFVVSQ